MRHALQSAVLSATLVVPVAAPLGAFEMAGHELLAVAAGLAAGGPRVPGSVAHERAQEALLGLLAGLGLQDVGRQNDAVLGVTNIQGVLRGRTTGEIVLAAHYDTVAGSPGALDDAAGCAVAIGVVAELAAVPIGRSLRVLFFDGEESGLGGSLAWVDSLGPGARDAVLAAVHLEMVGQRGAGRPVVLTLGAGAEGGRPRLTPAWVVHAALGGARAVGFPLTVGDSVLSLPMQVALRSAGSTYTSDHEPLLAAGIPAILLSDFSLLRPYDAHHGQGDVVARLDAERLQSWVQAVAASLRRLDALAGRPIWEDEYLVAGGRVLHRRDLLWLGFLLWIGLVVRARPGPWRGLEAQARRRRGRKYLPGFAFRALFLGVALWIPALGAALVYPLGLLALWRPLSTAHRWSVQVLAALPIGVWLALLGWGYWRGFLGEFVLSVPKVLLLVLTMAAFGWQLWWEEGAIAPKGATSLGTFLCPSP